MRGSLSAGARHRPDMGRLGRRRLLCRVRHKKLSYFAYTLSGDTQIYEVSPPAEVTPDGRIVGRGDGPAGSGGSDDDQGAGGTRDGAERDCPAAGRDGGGGPASPPAHGGGGGGRAVVAAAAGGEPGR